MFCFCICKKNVMTLFLFIRIKNTCNIELEDMLLFDDERRNIEDLEYLGIVCVLVKNGMTMQVLMDGLKTYSDVRTY